MLEKMKILFYGVFLLVSVMDPSDYKEMFTDVYL